MSTDRPFPQSVQAERALLGQLLRDPDLVDRISPLIQAEDFYRAEHGALYDLIVGLRDEGVAVDLVTLPERIAQEQDADRYGGLAYVVELPDHAPSRVNVEHYAEIVADRATRRQLITTAQGMIESAHGAVDVSEALAMATDQVSTLQAPGRWRSKTAGEALDTWLDEQERIANGDNPPAVSLGFRDLDAALGGGAEPGDLVILAARPSMGKSALALNMLLKATDPGGDVRVGGGFFNLEMSEKQSSQRMISAWAGIPLDTVRDPRRWDQQHWDDVTEAVEEFSRWPMYWDHRPGLTLEQVRTEAQRWKLKDPGLKLIVLDYLGMMPAPLGMKREATGRNAAGLKDLAKELDVVVVVLCQLNRNVENREDKTPLLADLRDSGEIEQHADLVLFVHRPHYYDRQADRRLAYVTVAKQRMGRRAVRVPLNWYGEVQLFVNQPTRNERLAEKDEQRRREREAKAAAQREETAAEPQDLPFDGGGG